jgi:DNA-binding protein HU-beta
MNKSDLVDAVAEVAGLTKVDTNRAIDAIVQTITEALKKGDNVRWLGFGIFTTAKRVATTGRNPRTGAIIQIPERRIPRFRAGETLKNEVAEASEASE